VDTGTLRIMRVGIRRVLSWVAIYAIALHTILLSVAPLTAAPTIDPFSVICHSEGSATSPAEQTPAIPVSAPSHACDYCNLCNAMAPPDELDSVVAAQLVPARLLHILRPATAATRDGIAANLKRARGPPSFA
jgi:hypothetical protein